MYVFNNRNGSNSVKSCARDLIFVSKYLVECPPKHTIQNSIIIFPTVPFVTAQHMWHDYAFVSSNSNTAIVEKHK